MTRFDGYHLDMDEAFPSPEKGLTLESLTRIQRERLLHIDFTLYFLGELRRADVIERFGTAPAGATRDIAMYKELAPENLDFDNGAKVYRPTSSFKPLFEHAPQHVFATLSQRLGTGTDLAAEPLIRCEFPMALNVPKAEVVAPITRAIKRSKAVSLTYHSVTSGTSQREIVPLALVNIGARWHVRAFDRKNRTFLDFVFTRMENVRVLEDSPIAREETADQDVQWSRLIDLELVPHPDHPRPEIVRRDYEMPDGVLKVRVRAANAGYTLRNWNVDCSPDHSLSGVEYSLWLPEPLALYGVSNAAVAPGYVFPSQSTTKSN